MAQNNKKTTLQHRLEKRYWVFYKNSVLATTDVQSDAIKYKSEFISSDIIVFDAEKRTFL